MSEISARGRIRELVKIRIEDADEFSIPVMTDSILALLREDEPFLQEFMETTLRNEVYELIGDVVKASRNLIQLGEHALTPDALERRTEKFASRFLGWYEHAGDKHVNLMEMSREDLLVAAAERRTRGQREYRIAALWSQLAEGLEGGQAVKDRFTAEEIEGLYTRIEGAEKGEVA